MLVYGDEQVRGDPAVHFAAMVAEVDAFNASLRESGEMVAVAPPRTVRAPGGVPVVSDGPYLEAEEHMGSFFLVDVDEEERALEIARSYPVLRHAPGGGLEVWPLTTRGDAPA